MGSYRKKLQKDIVEEVVSKKLGNKVTEGRRDLINRGRETIEAQCEKEKEREEKERKKRSGPISKIPDRNIGAHRGAR